jgi:hypothetical protein
MNEKHGNLFEEAQRDPVVTRLRHDMRNKETAFRLSAEVLGRVQELEKQERLRHRIIEQADAFGVALDTYLEALGSALARTSGSLRGRLGRDVRMDGR